jgi:uncharacterized SAM-binding protein YcdF (DUF218 family)
MFLLWPIKLAIRLIELIVLAAIVYLVVTGVQVVEASRIPTNPAAAPHADDIVVLSAPLTAGVPGPDLIARLEQAASLYRLGRAHRVVLSGPVSAPGVASETSVAGDWLGAHGVPAADRLTVPGANASAQLRAVGAVLGPDTPVLVVTDAIDAMWTERAAPEDGLSVTVVPALGSEPLFLKELGAVWRETSAVAAGRIIGFGRASWA